MDHDALATTTKPPSTKQTKDQMKQPTNHHLPTMADKQQTANHWLAGGNPGSIKDRLPTMDDQRGRAWQHPSTYTYDGPLGCSKCHKKFPLARMVYRTAGQHNPSTSRARTTGDDRQSKGQPTNYGLWTMDYPLPTATEAAPWTRQRVVTSTDHYQLPSTNGQRTKGLRYDIHRLPTTKQKN
ncbi:hypothetical protein EDD17DRAFT_1509031 [Pisolithus thermaeus]|nr:hypothetical protein EDD17DRAFT_1509031 [Pisolithus thermaeus]